MKRREFLAAAAVAPIGVNLLAEDGPQGCPKGPVGVAGPPGIPGPPGIVSITFYRGSFRDCNGNLVTLMVAGESDAADGEPYGPDNWIRAHLDIETKSGDPGGLYSYDTYDLDVPISERMAVIALCCMRLEFANFTRGAARKIIDEALDLIDPSRSLRELPAAAKFGSWMQTQDAEVVAII